MRLPLVAKIAAAAVWLLSWLLPPVLLSLAVQVPTGLAALAGLSLAVVGSVVGIVLAGMTARSVSSSVRARGIRRRTLERQRRDDTPRRVEEDRQRTRGGLVD